MVYNTLEKLLKYLDNKNLSILYFKLFCYVLLGNVIYTDAFKL